MHAGAGGRWRVAAAAACCCALLAVPAPAGADSPVVPADANTTVTTTADGKLRVNIAAPDASGLSHNRYTAFDVPRSGVELDNRLMRARTILNEVVSARPSRLEGELSVLGQPAHVIIANPNGITVDGATFRNTSGVVLVTGSLQASGTQRLFVPGSGSISISGSGLAATLSHLELISRQLRISASVSAGSQHQLKITAGPFKALLDAAATDARQLLNVQEAPDGSPAEVRIVIEQGAHLSGGTIQLTTTGAGNGVRLLGSATTADGQFWITASGDVELRGATVRARTNVFVAGTNVRVEEGTSLTAETSGIKLDATGNITVAGSTLQGAKKSDAGFDSLGAVSMRAGGDITIGRFADRDTLLKTTGDGIDIAADGSISDAYSRFDSADAVYFQARDDIRLTASTLVSQRNIRMEAELGDLDFDQPDIQAGDSLLLYGRHLSLRSGQLRRAQLLATSGGVFGMLEGDMINEGGLIQGSIKVQGITSSYGGVTFIIRGRLTNRTTAVDRIASLYAEKDDLYIEADRGVDNLSGRLLSAAALRIISKGQVLNEALRTSTVRESRRSGGTLLNRRQLVEVDYGTLAAGSEVGQIKATGKLSIQAASFVNRGSEVAADEVDIATDGDAVNESITLGRTWLEKKCFLFFCRYSGGGTITLETATITANTQLRITSGGLWRDSGGTLQAGTEMYLRASRFTFGSLLWREYYARPAGFGGFFSGWWGKLRYDFQGTDLQVLQGRLTIDSDTDVEAYGLSIIAAQGHEMRNARQLVIHDEPPQLRRLNRSRIGIFPFWLF